MLPLCLQRLLIFLIRFLQGSASLGVLRVGAFEDLTDSKRSSLPASPEMKRSAGARSPTSMRPIRAATCVTSPLAGTRTHESRQISTQSQSQAVVSRVAQLAGSAARASLTAAAGAISLQLSNEDLYGTASSAAAAGLDTRLHSSRVCLPSYQHQPSAGLVGDSDSRSANEHLDKHLSAVSADILAPNASGTLEQSSTTMLLRRTSIVPTSLTYHQEEVTGGLRQFVNNWHSESLHQLHSYALRAWHAAKARLTSKKLRQQFEFQAPLQVAYHRPDLNSVLLLACHLSALQMMCL